MSWTNSLNRDVSPAQIGKAIAALLAVGLVAALVTKGIPYALRLRRENQYQALRRIKYSVSGETPAIAAQKLVVRDLTGEEGERIFHKRVEVARLLVTKTFQRDRDFWKVSGIGLVKANAGSESFGIIWSRELRWAPKEQLWFGDGGDARYIFKDDRGHMHSSGFRRVGT